MGIFSMGGAQITGPLAFREHFDALDFLSQLELAAGFAVLQLGCLSAWDKYNSEVLYQSVFLGRECLDSPLSRPQDYLELDMFLDAREERAVRSMLGDARVLGTLRAVWDLAESAGDALAAPGADPQWARSRFFLALSAGCLLARRSLGEPVPEPACAAAAYLKRPLARDAGRWLQLPDGGRLTLEPRAEPYRVLLDARGIQRLPRGEHLSLCRLAAAPAAGPWSSSSTAARMTSTPIERPWPRGITATSPWRAAGPSSCTRSRCKTATAACPAAITGSSGACTASRSRARSSRATSSALRPSRTAAAGRPCSPAVGWI